MTNMMLDPISQLTVVNTRLTERRREAADTRLGRIAARTHAQAPTPSGSLRRPVPAGRTPTSRLTHATSGRG